MKSRRLAVSIALAGLTIAASACAAAGGQNALEGTSWILASIDGLAPVPGSTITAAFDVNGQVGGSSGCNSYSASYLTEGDSLTIGRAVGTLMACEEPVMQQESKYLEALSATASYAISGDALTLRDSSGAARLVFAAQSSALLGSSWRVTSYNNRQGGVVSVIAGTRSRGSPRRRAGLKGVARGRPGLPPVPSIAAIAARSTNRQPWRTLS
jgi:heat shock protein HslJ